MQRPNNNYFVFVCAFFTRSQFGKYPRNTAPNWKEKNKLAASSSSSYLNNFFMHRHLSVKSIFIAESLICARYTCVQVFGSGSVHDYTIYLMGNHLDITWNKIRQNKRRYRFRNRIVLVKSSSQPIRVQEAGKRRHTHSVKRWQPM